MSSNMASACCVFRLETLVATLVATPAGEYMSSSLASPASSCVLIPQNSCPRSGALPVGALSLILARIAFLFFYIYKRLDQLEEHEQTHFVPVLPDARRSAPPAAPRPARLGRRAVHSLAAACCLGNDVWVAACLPTPAAQSMRKGNRSGT